MKVRIGKTAWLLGLLLVAGVIPACGPGKPAVDRSEEEKALRALDIAWSEAANRKDVDAVVSYMADDGETLPPHEPAARGQAAIKASWANLLGLPALSIRWEPQRVQVAESGELGFTSGIYMLTYNDANGQLVADRGKYLEVWKKVDGKWKCVSDAFNSDLPLP
jgi:ketosteroid isomerase-like protein